MVWAVVLTVALGASDPYQCLFRQLALEYADDVVLCGWGSTNHRRSAYASVAKGLRIDECNASFAHFAPPLDETSRAPGAAHTLFVAPTGDDAAAGTSDTPLATIRGAQARIRALYPPGSTRAPRTRRRGATAPPSLRASPKPTRAPAPTRRSSTEATVRHERAQRCTAASCWTV